jgi:hypothetical protein
MVNVQPYLANRLFLGYIYLANRLLLGYIYLANRLFLGYIYLANRLFLGGRFGCYHEEVQIEQV